MSMRSETSGKGRMARSLLRLVVVLASACLVSAPAAGAGFEERVRTLSQVLELDAAQQSELRKLLEAQRDQVGKVWSDASVPPAYRVVAVQAISDRTADRIRAMLNDEQRKKYIPPRLPREALAATATPDVEAWMAGGKAKPAGPERKQGDHDVDLH